MTQEITKEVKELQELINNHDNIVFFGGAGVSTESGIQDFRSQDGLYNQKYDYPPETILSHSFFMRKPEEFFKFYRVGNQYSKLTSIIIPPLRHIICLFQLH